MRMRINIQTVHIKTNQVNMVSVFCIHKITRKALWKYIQYINEILMCIWLLRFHCSWVYMLNRCSVGIMYNYMYWSVLVYDKHVYNYNRLHKCIMLHSMLWHAFKFSLQTLPPLHVWYSIKRQCKVYRNPWNPSHNWNTWNTFRWQP